MKRTLLAGIAAVTLAFAPQIASAADVPVRKAPAVPVAAAPSWNGLYVGFVAGWLRYNARWEDLETTVFGIRTFNNVDGGTIGGTVGWNWQIFPAWVIGVEADWSWANVRGSSLCPEFAFAAQCGIKIKDVGTVRGRFGYVWGSALVYATGGWTSIGTDTTFEVRQTFAPGTFLETVEVASRRSGSNIGGGVEWMMTPNLSFKLDAIHHRMNDKDFDRIFGGGTFEDRHREHLSFWQMRLGLNWKLDWFAFGKSPVGKAPAAVVAKY